MPLPPVENPVDPESTDPIELSDAGVGNPDAGSKEQADVDRPFDDITASLEMTVPLADLVGRTVGHFVIQERIGSGAMSVVYRAEDQRTGDQRAADTVALKVLLPGADGVARSRFRQEAQTALQLNHPQIIRTFEVGQVDAEGLTYISMELVDGESLADLLERHRQLSIFDTCLILERIARALDYAHGRGIVHRDVKPSNILLRTAEDGAPGSVQLSVLGYPVVPILSDFGIARALDAPELTSMGRTVGTPSYMAPEQCSGSHEIDGRADIYALGTVFYRCLVGRPPYVGTTTQVLYAHVYSPLTIPDEVLVNLPMPVIDILRRSLMKDPAGRYATALAMAIDMARITGNVEFQMSADDVNMSEVTATMTALPATERTTSTSSTVLVPSRQTNMSPLVGRRPGGAGTKPAPGRRSRSIADKSRREMNRVSMGIGLALATLLLILIAAVTRVGIPEIGAIVQRPADEGQNIPPLPDVGSPDGSTANGQDSSDDAAANGGDGDVVEVVEPTPAAVPHPDVGVEEAWRNALLFYRDGDWLGALDPLTLLFRNDEEINRRLVVDEESRIDVLAELFAADAEPEFLEPYRDLIDPKQVEEMLFDSFTGLAAQAAARNQIENARNLYMAAVTIRPDSPEEAALADVARTLVDALPVNLPDARRQFQQALVSYAGYVEEQGRSCNASAQLAAADGVLPNAGLRAELIRLEAVCSSLIQAEKTRQYLSELDGRLIYSASVDGRHQILSRSVKPDSPSSVLIEQAAQPALAPDGAHLTYYSSAPDRMGLWSVEPGSDSGQRGRQLTRHPEDGEESPVAWSSDSTRLAFSSRRAGDRQSRIYVSWSDGSDDRNIAYGVDPAWQPDRDWIVHNGTDRTGNQPGLWLSRSDGAESEQLTKIASDLQPTWTPDGQQIVFTSDGRDGNRELYRLDISQGIVTRLTTDPAQDVAPTVSPDGGHVAFYSDRGGDWGIWVIEIGGGNPVLVTPVDGTIDDWLRHAIQWVE